MINEGISSLLPPCLPSSSPYYVPFPLYTLDHIPCVISSLRHLLRHIPCVISRCVTPASHLLRHPCVSPASPLRDPCAIPALSLRHISCAITSSPFLILISSIVISFILYYIDGMIPLKTINSSDAASLFGLFLLELPHSVCCKLGEGMKRRYGGRERRRKGRERREEKRWTRRARGITSLHCTFPLDSTY